MQTVFEAAGCNDGLRRLADAWHRRVMADDEVAHAFRCVVRRVALMGVKPSFEKAK